MKDRALQDAAAAQGNTATDHGLAEGQLIAERFLLKKLLRESSGNSTYLGVDTRTGENFVVKAIPVDTLSFGALTRLEHEAAQLAQVRSRWVAPLVHSGRHGDAFVLVMKHVEGCSLDVRLDKAALTAAEAIELGRDIFSALCDLHEHRVVHRGVRPTNIIVNRRGLINEAVLVDFGPARAIQTEHGLLEHPLAAARYVSPEQAGLIDHDVTDAADLYSAGLVLYRCLAGKSPFQGDTVGTILFEQMTIRVPELRELGVSVPRAFDEVLQRLLRKDPRDRYQSAAAVLADIEAIADGARNGTEDRAVVIGARDCRVTITEPAFVTRTRELEGLDEQLQKARAGNGGLVFLEGESGSGKSRLLSEAAYRAGQHGFRVFRGMATVGVAQNPLRVFEGIVEGVLSASKSEPGLAETLRERIDDYRESVASALPGLADLLVSEVSRNEVPESFGEARTVLALARLLQSLGSAQRPALVVLDDCQWAGELSYKLVRRWHAAASQAGQQSHVVVLVAFRSEEVDDEHLLRQAEPTSHLRLLPLEASEVRKIVESMVGRIPEEAMEVIVRLSGGSPFMASAVLRGLVETGALVAGADGWQTDPLAMANVSSSSRSAAFLTRRLELLPHGTIQLLSAGAVLGKEFGLDVVSELVRQKPSEAILALDEARERCLIWLKPDGAKCVFVHDKIRSALLERLSAEQRRDIHRRAAAYLQANTPQDVSSLAYHFDAAGDSQAALPYALTAAENARAQHVLETAEQQYRIAERGSHASSSETQFRIATGLGDVLMLRGQYAAAGGLFTKAASWAEGRLARAQIQSKLGELAFKRGSMDESIDCCETALAYLGRSSPKRIWIVVLVVVWETFVQMLHTWFPRLFLHRLRRQPNETERLYLQLLSNLSHVSWYSRSKIVAFRAHLREMNFAEKFLPCSELAQAYSLHAPAMTLVPAHRRAVRYAEKSLQIRRMIGDRWGEGQTLGFYGIALYCGSRYTECIEKCQEAVRLLERMGDFWTLHISRYQIAASYYHLGNSQEALRQARLNHASGLDTGDEQTSGIILDVWVRATAGEIPEKILATELERNRTDAQGTAQVLLAEGICLIQRDQLDQAATVLEKAVHTVSSAGINNAYTIPVRIWLATVRRLQAACLSDCTRQRREHMLRRADRAARRAVRATRICKNDLPQALREYGLVSAMRGKLGKARRLFQRSRLVAGRHQARFEEAQACLAMAKVGHEAGWRDADSRETEGLALLAQLQANSPVADAAEIASLSLADRFDTVLDSGRKIAGALTPESIHESARLAAMRLLRGESCTVVPVDADGDGEPRTLATHEDETKSLPPAELLCQALHAGRAVVADDEIDSASADVASEPAKRSALCVPLFVRGRAVACLYVTHGHLQGLFGTDEERLADFVATIAGAALENAENFTELQSLNETLEGRVADRTAAAESRARQLAASNHELARIADELRQTEDDLRVAKQTAESANEAKSRFLATMSHEIRTPMNGVLGMTEIVLGTSLSNQQRNYMGVVRDSAQALLAIINDVLDFSKIEAGRMEIENLPFVPADVIGDATRLLAVSASLKGIELICRVAPELPNRIQGDPGRLRQVIVNLVGNAVKFTNQGEVYVDVWRESATEESINIHVAVKDTGIGIPEEKINCIFEAFRQSDNSTTRRFGGSGLGLTISSQIVEMMGGKIWVESRLGRGSEFHFVVPLECAEPDAPQPAGQPRRRQTVLLFARNDHARHATKEVLETAGWRVEATGRVTELLSLVSSTETSSNAPAAIVIDIAAAGSTGLELAELLTCGNAVERLPIVLLEPAGQMDSAERCARIGIEQSLTKPAKPLELIEAVSQVTEFGDLSATAGAKHSETTAAQSLRVLVADDSPINQEVAAGILELRGCLVVTVDDGREAVEAFQREPFDIILMDLEMPEMDGLAATAAIRQIEQADARTRTPIIALTAHAVKDVRRHCIEAGMDGFVSKPIQPTELFLALEENTQTALA